MASTRETNLYFTSEDLSALAANIEASIHPGADGSPRWVEPEPNQTKRRRFWRDDEVPTGFMATLSVVGPGKARPSDPISCHLLFDRPQSEDAPSLDLRATSPEGVLRSGNIELPPGWSTSIDSVFDDGLALSTDDVRPTPPLTVARLVVDTLTAMGAPLPTGRWRTSESYLVYNDF